MLRALVVSAALFATPAAFACGMPMNDHVILASAFETIDEAPEPVAQIELQAPQLIAIAKPQKQRNAPVAPRIGPRA